MLPCHIWDKQPASFHVGPGSIPGQILWDFGLQSERRADFLRVLPFPLPILIPPTHDSYHQTLYGIVMDSDVEEAT
jgi:hypothetical protein